MDWVAAMIGLTLDGDRATVAITGDIDITNDEQLHQAFWEAVNAEPAENIVDLDGVGVFASAGVNALVWAWQELRDSATVLQVYSPGKLTSTSASASFAAYPATGPTARGCIDPRSVSTERLTQKGAAGRRTR